MARRGENIHKRKDGRWEGRYIKARTPDRRICWGYIYGTTYAEVKQRLIHKKSEYGGFQLIDAHLTFTELAEAWLQSVKCGLKESTCAHSRLDKTYNSDIYKIRLDRYFLKITRIALIEEIAHLNENGWKSARTNINRIANNQELNQILKTYPLASLPKAQKIFFCALKQKLYLLVAVLIKINMILKMK